MRSFARSRRTGCGTSGGGAEWFALISSGIYLPVEVYEIFHRFGWVKFSVFITNIIVVLYMAYALHAIRRSRTRAGATPRRGAAA